MLKVGDKVKVNNHGICSDFNKNYLPIGTVTEVVGVLPNRAYPYILKGDNYYSYGDSELKLIPKEEVSTTMKHIKFQALPVGPDFQKVKVTILEQTHRGYGFGWGCNYFAHNGFAISSIDFPDTGGGKVFMRGSNAYRDNNSFTIDVATYAKFKAAVEEYNRVFAAPAKPVAPKVAPCAVIIG